MKYLTAKQLAKELNYSYMTLYTYLSRPEFNRFRARKKIKGKNGRKYLTTVYIINNEFMRVWNHLINYSLNFRAKNNGQRKFENI